LKVVVVPIDNEPHLIFVASQAVDVGDELLFDYNDRQSPMPFLKACPDCDDQPTTSSRHSAPAPAVSTVADTGRKRARETAQDADEQDHTRRPESSAAGDAPTDPPTKKKKMDMFSFYWNSSSIYACKCSLLNT